MNEIKGWAILVCVSAIACSLLDMIVPSGKMEKIVRFVFGVFMICAVINPFVTATKGFDIDLKIPNSEIKKDYKFSESMEDIEMRAAECKIKNILEETLDEINIEPQKINISMDINEENSISINKVEVVLGKENIDRQEEVKSIIKNKLGLNCKVYT